MRTKVGVPREFSSSALSAPLRSSASPSSFFPASYVRQGAKGKGEGGREGGKGEFTGRSKSFARKAKTLANGCFSWAEYLKKGGREGGRAAEKGGRGCVAAVGSAKRRK